MTVAQQTILASSPACALARLPRVWSWQKLSGPHPWLVRPNVLDEEWKDQGVLKFYVAKCPKWLFSTRAAKRNANQTVSADKTLEKTCLNMSKRQFKRPASSKTAKIKTRIVENWGPRPTQIPAGFALWPGVGSRIKSHHLQIHGTCMNM